jgi:uncharacterized protein
LTGTIELRGHHLLCLLGFRGMGYSPEFTSNMAAVYEALRTDPSTIVRIVQGVDHLCACYPTDKPYHCDSASVQSKDDQVLKQLGLQPGDQTCWSDIINRVRAHIAPEDLHKLCASCPWLKYGVCEAGVSHIRGGGSLPPLSK